MLKVARWTPCLRLWFPLFCGKEWLAGCTPPQPTRSPSPLQGHLSPAPAPLLIGTRIAICPDSLPAPGGPGITLPCPGVGGDRAPRPWLPEPVEPCPRLAHRACRCPQGLLAGLQVAEGLQASGQPTWYLMSMLKNSSPGSWVSPLVRRWPTLLWVIRSPGRLPTLARWSSSRRLWELAMRSKNSSVCGEAVTEDWAVGGTGVGCHGGRAGLWGHGGGRCGGLGCGGHGKA